MHAIHAIPLLLSILVGFLLGLVALGLVQLRRPSEGLPMSTSDDVLVGFLVLAAFALGVFLTYVVLGALL